MTANVMSGSAGGRAEQDLHRQAPHRAADPSGWCMDARRSPVDELTAGLQLDSTQPVPPFGPLLLN